MKLKQKFNKANLLDTLLSPEISILIPLLILCIYTSSVAPTFLKLKNIQVILRYTAFVGTLAIGEAFALMCGEIDLSIGTCSTLAGVIFAVALSTYGTNLFVAILLALVVALLVGIFNAFMTLVFGMTSWIVTMASQYICIGFATVICRGAAISGLGDTVKAMNVARPLGLSWMFFIMIGFLIVTEILIRFTPVGRAIHCVGLNPMAARIAGVNVKKTKALCMIFCSIMGGVCGVLQVINTVAANDALGKGNEFPAIICCVIGGVSASGGKGSMLGVLIGVLMYQTMKNCLQMLGFNSNTQMVLTGLILILAVAIDVFKGKLSLKRK